MSKEYILYDSMHMKFTSIENFSMVIEIPGMVASRLRGVTINFEHICRGNTGVIVLYILSWVITQMYPLFKT